MALTAVGMALGLLVDVLTAARLGAGTRSDALIVALTLPILLDTILREGTRFSLIAFFLEHRTSNGGPAHARFISAAVNFALLTGLAVAMLFLVAAPLLVRLLGPGLTPEGHQDATVLLRLLTPVLVFAPGATMLGVYLNSQRTFIPVALRNAIAPGFVILAYGLGWHDDAVVRWVAVGYGVGFASYFLTLLRSATHAGHRQDWRAWPTPTELRGLWTASYLPTFGFGVRQMARVAERSLASLGPQGSVAAYYFAFRIFSACQTIIGTSLATTGLPHMAEMDLAGKRDRLARIIARNVGRAYILGTATALFFVLFRSPIVHIVYGRGMLSAEAITLIASLFLWFGLGVAFTSATPVLQSGLFAQRDYRAVLQNMVVIGVLNVGLDVLAFPWLGLTGLALASSVAAFVSNLTLVRLLAGRGVHLLTARRGDGR
jgi:putative peptidoglycan lipid II flippase